MVVGVSIVLPCCNEEGALGQLPGRLFPTLVRLAARATCELIVVDDGSRDGTPGALAALRAAAAGQPWELITLRHERNRGLGAALRTGQAAARGAIVVTCDADGSYDFALIAPLVAAIEGGADLATVSPYHRAGGIAGVSRLRLLLSRGASRCYQLLVDRRIATYTALVRAYRAETLAAAIPEETGFLHVAMTLVEARRRGARVVEVPATLARRREGVSKARLARTTRAHLRYLARLAWLRASGRFWLTEAGARTVAPGSGAARR